MVSSVRHIVSNMSGVRAITSLIYACRKAERAHQPLHLALNYTDRIYPNGAVPMAATLQFFKLRGLQIYTSDISYDVERTDFLNPRVASKEELDRDSVQNAIWRYENERQATDLCNAFIDHVKDNADCWPGLRSPPPPPLLSILHHLLPPTPSQPP